MQHNDEQDKPYVKYVANMHGDEVVGRQLLFQLAHFLLYNYGHNERLTWLLNNTQIVLIPSVNPDGFQRSIRENVNMIDLNRDFPDQFLCECFAHVL